MTKDLTKGAPLIIEELDCSDLGLYLKKDSSVPDDDYFDSGYRSFGKILWARKSDEGKKWCTYEDKEIVKWPEIK